MSLYDEFTRAKPQFDSNREAFDHFKKEYEALGTRHGMTGDQFWSIANGSIKFDEDEWEILGLARRMNMAKSLMEKYG